MSRVPAELDRRLAQDLRHRLRPMTGRDPDERDRASTPLELLYDLTYVIAFGAAAEALAHHLAEGETWPVIGAYLFAIFSISWAWMNFTWFSSAYGNDDALVRVATIVQMVGVIILTFGLPVSFDSAAEGESPNNALLVIGYVITRVPLIGLWLRAARQDPEHRRTATSYAVTIAIAQTAWALTAIVHLPVPATVTILVVLAFGEMAAPVILERRLGLVPWNAGHIAERFGLLTIITLGEVIAATTGAVAALIDSKGWSTAAVLIAASGLFLAAALWWAYYLIPARPLLEQWPQRTWAWRYAHLPIFGAIAAIGAGLRVAADAVGEGHLSLVRITVSLVVPVAAVLLMIFATWSVLTRSFDASHAPLLIASLAPLAGAIIVAVAAGHGHLEAGRSSDLVALAAVVVLVALACVVEVIGHERVGYRHTVRALEDSA